MNDQAKTDKPATPHASAHTPGPWNVTTRTDRAGGREIDAGAEHVATAADFNRFDRDAEVYANARLIAAAPDLLAALQDIADFINSNGHTDAEIIRRFRGRARAALAKAGAR